MDILNITDGTTTLNLYNLTDGYSVSGWRQAIAQYKGGGIYVESSISTGRQLVLRRHANALDTIPIHISGAEPDVAARAVRDLIALLEKAADYWEYDWQNDEVWLEARDDGETETRYGLVVSGQLFDLPDQHSLARLDERVVYDNVTLTIERQHWTENEPGAGTAVALSMVQTYKARLLGNVDSTGTREPTTNNDQVYMANKHNIAQLTHIYYRDTGVGWSGNLMSAALPTTLLPAVPAVNDFIVFGIETAEPDSGPFCSLAFDLSQAQTGCTMQWEYWDGAAPWGNWVGKQFQDNTNAGGILGLGEPFDTVGRGTVHWEQQSDWVTGNLFTIYGGAAPNITLWMVRCVVTAIPGALQPPIQQNRDIYTITWGCTEILEDVTEGDLASLAEWRLSNMSSMLTNSYFATARLLLGLRSYDRGPTFQSYLNFGNTQLITGQANNALFGAHVADPTDITGNTFRYTPAAAATVTIYYIELDSSMSEDFYGRFRVFLRLQESAGSGAVDIRLSYRVGQFHQTYANSDYVTIDPGLQTEEIVDLGTVSIPGANVSLPADWRVYLIVRSAGAPYPTLNFRDIVLIPADEWIVDGLSPDNAYLDLYRYLSIDSISWPKNWLTAITVHNLLNTLTELWSARTGDVSQLVKRGERQRLWGVALSLDDWSSFGIAHWTQCLKNDRSLSPRGDS